MNTKVWQSRFPDRTEDPVFEALNASIGFDRRLYKQELAASAAHASALADVGIYTEEELLAVRGALGQIEKEIETGQIDLDGFEDIHTAVENRLTEIAGPAGEKIQTGRSRNEQTVTAQRLYLKEAAAELTQAIAGLQAALLKRAEDTVDVLLPGFTHGRPAQPIRFAHYLAAHVFGLARDQDRIKGAASRIDASPAGVAALAGAAFPIDREAEARALGFAGPSHNALDTVSDRDGPMEFLSHMAVVMVRLSRLAEDFILWSSPAYGFLELGDTYCTSSSLMPQKKNPDGLELVRGKTGRVISDLMSLLVTCKGLPTGYQKDLQEDKEPLFDAVDTVLACLAICQGVVAEVSVNAEVMATALTDDCMATDLADDLVSEGLPFRRAYAEVAARFANPSSERRPVPSPAASTDRRRVLGGTARDAVLAQLVQARRLIGAEVDPAP
jgi:argininosuccinate lyase